MITVDELWTTQRLCAPGLLKIDVQGGELEVIKGALESMRYFEAVILEATFFDYFIGGSQFTETIGLMNAQGFVLYDIVDYLYRPIDNALSQVDLVFVRKEGMFRIHHVYATSEQREKQNSLFQRMHMDS
jgi:hypothetical protein